MSLSNVALLASVFGIIVSIAQGGINVLLSVFNLITEPLVSGATVIATAFEATIVAPLGVLIAGADASAQAIHQFGILGPPFGVFLLLAAIWWWW